MTKWKKKGQNLKDKYYVQAKLEGKFIIKSRVFIRVTYFVNQITTCLLEQVIRLVLT